MQPSYTEWHPSADSENDPKVLVISADGRENSATIHQDVDVYLVRVPAGQSISHDLANGRGLWLQLIKGQLTTGEETLLPGDATSSETSGTFVFTATEVPEALLFDLA